MSYGNAVRQREEMIAEYERMLKSTTIQSRIDDINHQIAFLTDEINELKKGKPLFGRPKPLQQTRTIIEPDRESPTGQKVTVINPPTEKSTGQGNAAPSKRLGNKLRDALKPKVSNAAENALKAKIEAVKAAKKA